MLTTEQIERRRKYLIKHAQREVEHSEKFIKNQKRFNLHKNLDGIYKCRGGIEAGYLVYIPSESVLSQKTIFSAHKGTSRVRAAMPMTMFIHSTLFQP